MNFRSEAPPKGYSFEARALWREVVEGWQLDPAALLILDTGCRALQRLREAQAQLKQDGAFISDRFGQLRAHPAQAVERDAALLLLRTFKQLGLDLEPVHNRVGRPSGPSPVSERRTHANEEG